MLLLLLLLRGFPGWVTSDPSHPLTNATADYTVRWLLAARRLHNLTIDYIGIWNERDFSRDYILALRDRLTASQLSTVIVAADGWYGICDSMTGDTELQSAIAYIGLHYPSESTTAACAALPQPTWASEDFSSYYQAGGCWSRLLNRNYVYANLTAAISWSPIASYYDESASNYPHTLRLSPRSTRLTVCCLCLSVAVRLPYSGVGLMLASSPWSGHYAVDQALWVTAHTTHFADIGWRYLEHGSGVGRLQGGGTYVSLTDGQGGLTVIVEAMGPDVSYCINEGPQSPNVTKQQVVFTLAGDFASITQLFAFYSSFDPTRPIVQFQYAGVVDVADGSFSFTLLPDAMFTFSTRNASKGAHPTPPSPSAFPLPHSDSFDHYALYSEARYLIDQSGSFEIVEAADSSRGRVMRQSVTAAPAVWCDEAPYPFSIIGSHSWRAVNASVDVLIESSGMALLAAGVVTGGCMGSAGSVGLTFAISTDGHWLVSNSTSLKPQLAAGQLQVDANTWYRLHVAVTDSGTALSVNGKLLTTLAEWTAASGNGWVAIGSDFSNVQYDRLRITLSREEKETAPQLPQQASHRHVRPVTLI